MFGNMLKRSRSSSNSTDLDLLAGIPTTICELEGKDGIPSMAKILFIKIIVNHHMFFREYLMVEDFKLLPDIKVLV